MKLKVLLLSSLLACSFPAAKGFCGFYVAKADTKLFNKASQVVMARDGDRTVLTMANDFRGDPKEFAMVIPVPTFLERDQIHVGEKAVIDHLDAFTSPRLVEYFDEDPCQARFPMKSELVRRYGLIPASEAPARAADALGVKIEAEYTIGEYDIIILSAEQSNGLETWLKQNGYRLPDGASTILEGYIKQKLRFFVAKVNLSEQNKLGYSYLRPLQIAFESPKFMLPIRLGTLNAEGPQELFIYTLTRKGRVESVNYRTVKLPTDLEIPVYVKEVFGDFYKALFSQLVRKENMRVLFQEYAWDMGWCDPCAADPLTHKELKSLGVFWLDEPKPVSGGRLPAEAFVTRLHVRYDAQNFPEDLMFQETADRNKFQGRYVLRHPWRGTSSCPEATAYATALGTRLEKEAATLANLTGWDINQIRKKMNLAAVNGPSSPKKWYQKLWE